MFVEYWGSRMWMWPAYGLAVLILSLWVLHTWVDTVLNDWTGRFYAELETALKAPAGSSIDPFQTLMFEWAWKSGLKIMIMPFINWFTRIWAFQWREALTMSYLHRWRVMGDKDRKLPVESVSQRIQEDAYELTKKVDSLGQGFFNATLQLAAFTPLLWTLSRQLQYSMEGVLVWACMLGNIGGFLLSLLIGQGLVLLEYNAQRDQAAFRKELVYAEDGVAGRGEIPECRSLFSTMRATYMRLFLHYTYFEVWIGLFHRSMEVIPILIMVPSLYAGSIDLGAFMKAMSAFDHVNKSMSTITDRWAEVNSLRAVIKRLREFEEALPPLPEREDGGFSASAPAEAATESTPLTSAFSGKGQGRGSLPWMRTQFSYFFATPRWTTAPVPQ